MYTEIFGIPFFSTKLELKKSNFSLKKEFLSLEKKNKGVVKSNSGGFQSKTLLWNQKKYLFLRDKLLLEINNFLKILTVKEPFNIKYYPFWVNINRKDSYNKWHCHGSHHFSCVYYVSVPKNSSRIVFNTPVLHKKTSEIRYTNNNILSVCDELYYNVEEGCFLIFPSYLEHMVEPSKTTKPRISIAFNIDIEQNYD